MDTNEYSRQHIVTQGSFSWLISVIAQEFRNDSVQNSAVIRFALSHRPNQDDATSSAVKFGP